MSAVYHFASGSTSCHVNRHAKLVRVKKTSKSVEQPQNISTLNLMGAFRGVNMYVCMISFKRRKKKPRENKTWRSQNVICLWYGDRCKMLLRQEKKKFLKRNSGEAWKDSEPRSSVVCLSETRRCLPTGKKKIKITLTPGVLILMQWSLTPCRVSAPGEDWRRPAYPVNKERKEGGKKIKDRKNSTMLHQDAVCPAFDSTLGTHRLDLKFHAPRSRQNLSRDPRSLSKTLHLVNTIAQASSAWRPKGKFIQSIFFVANDYIMSIMRPDPLPGENAALWSFSQVGEWGGVVGAEAGC